ncbi:MAG: pentapeptide repeat-containing protein [Myxococcales bacterium]|nr:pentapeptide repeat-containing protein [Myxococcales bacterium]
MNCDFSNAALTDAAMDGMRLEGAVFSQAILEGVSLIGSSFSFASGSWGYTDLDEQSYTVNYNATVLDTDTTMAVCPSSSPGPCDTVEELTPIVPPNPVVPACVPSEEYCCDLTTNQPVSCLF